ncbi:hypothetical protein ABIC02_006930 [Bradyrhizobium sp. RT5a]
MTWCDQNDVDYLFGLAENSKLIVEIAAELAEAAAENRQSGKPARRFKDFHYRTHKSWSRERRVVGKAEWMIPSAAESENSAKPRRKKNKKSIMVADIDLATLEGRANPRFVVTSLRAERHPARELYEKLYCAHGEMENRIKECQLDLFADRTSTTPCAPTSYRFRCRQWPMSWSAHCAALPSPRRGSPTPHAAPSA